MGHFDTVARLERSHYWLGVPVVILSTVVGSSVFATLQEETDIWIKIAVGVFSILSAVLASMQTFLRQAERAEKHKAAAAQYGRLKKEIEQIRTFPPPDGEAGQAVIRALLEQIDKLATESPVIPKRIWDRIERKIEQERRPSAQAATESLIPSR
jgi:hypothetical protein